MTILLRPYQSELIQSASKAMREGHKSVLIQSETGSGKTVLSAHMLKSCLDKNKSAWFCVHRKELIDQTSNTFTRMGIPHGIIASGTEPTDAPLQLVLVNTAVNRLPFLTPPHMVVFDEAHY